MPGYFGAERQRIIRSPSGNNPAWTIIALAIQHLCVGEGWVFSQSSRSAHQALQNGSSCVVFASSRYRIGGHHEQIKVVVTQNRDG
jgi:hypothetical protein